MSHQDEAGTPSEGGTPHSEATAATQPRNCLPDSLQLQEGFKGHEITQIWIDEAAEFFDTPEGVTPTQRLNCQTSDFPGPKEASGCEHEWRTDTFFSGFKRRQVKKSCVKCGEVVMSEFNLSYMNPVTGKFEATAPPSESNVQHREISGDYVVSLNEKALAAIRQIVREELDRQK